MFQGMARGKVGDVVFYRMNGEQVSRVRNRHPKNPKTVMQLYQRAIMATIIQAYAAGKDIFDHSFQGKQVGEENMRTFLSRNMKLLRSQIASDLDNGTVLAQQVGRVVAPGSITPVPVNGLIVSEGTLSQTLFTITPANSGNPLTVKLPDLSSVTTKANEWAAANGLNGGDIYTFVAFTNDDNNIRFKTEGAIGNFGTQYNCKFGWYRLIVKAELPETAINAALISDLFDIEYDGEVFNTSIASEKFSGLVLNEENLYNGVEPSGVIGIIRSREDEKLRSTCELQPITLASQYGIVSQYVLAAWQQGSQKVGQSDLILEGGVDNGFQVEVGAPAESKPGTDAPPFGGD